MEAGAEGVGISSAALKRERGNIGELREFES